MPSDEGRSGIRRLTRPTLPVSGAPRYVIAAGVTAAALLIRFALWPWFGDHVPFLQFYPAILVAAWCGGLGPGILASVLSGLASMYFLLPPAGLGVGSAVDGVSLAVFLATGFTIAWLNHRLRTEAALASGHAERLDAIINTTVDGIVVIDRRGIIEAFNRGAERLFGYPASEVLGSNVRLLMPAPYHDEHDGYLARYLGTGDATIIGTGREVAGRRRDGSTFPLHLSVGEMRTGSEHKFVGMLHDLTSRAELEARLRASEGRWRAVIDSAADGIIVIDQQGRIESFNHGAERLFGYESAEVVGRNVSLLMPSPYHEEHDSYLARYLATGQPRIIGIGREVVGLRRDGTTFPLHLSVGEIGVGGERRYTGIVHDLSERVRMEQEMRERAALAKLGEMAAVIAHEVKNPLAGIRGAIEVIDRQMGAERTSPPILKEIVSRIDQLDRMMKDLLLFARTPVPRRAAIEVVPLVVSTATLLSHDPALRDVKVEVEGSAPPVVADADMLRIAFQNLLINAAHAMNGNGRVRVTVNAVQGACDVAFIDHGPGIPANVLEKIFTPFFTTKARGSGLGLATTKRIIEAHQGQIAVDCPASGGTTVRVRLPFDPPVRPAS
jgi:two-component system sensor kinase FixL